MRLELRVSQELFCLFSQHTTEALLLAYSVGLRKKLWSSLSRTHHGEGFRSQRAVELLAGVPVSF